MNLGNVACNDNEVGRQQCDQMAILFVQYLAFYNTEKMPNSIKFGSK